MAVQSQFPPISISSACSWLLGFVILYSIGRAVSSYRRLRHIRGPMLACVSQLWIFNATLKARVYLECEEALKNYGSPVRIGPNMILTDDPIFYRYMTAPRSTFTRGQFYKGTKFDLRIDNLLSMTDEKRHAELRAKLMPGYTGKEIPDLESSIDARVISLIRLVRREYADKAQILDFAKLAQYFALDSLTHLAFGQPIGFLEENKDLYDYNKSTSASFPILELGCNIPVINSILKSSIAQATAAPKPDDKTGFGAIIGIGHRAVAERFGPMAKQQRDMLGSFIAHGLTRQELESETVLALIAGVDSTATTIRCTFLFILTNPPVYAKLLAEIQAAVTQGLISSPVVRNQEAVEMRYLQACIKEGLRMWQPLLGLATRRSPPEGVTVKGVYVPGGVEVASSSWAMMKRKDVFGADADVFRPERWIDDDPEAIRAYEKVWELTFGYGRFSCLGKNIALMELNKVFVELLRDYDWGIVNPINPMYTRCNAAHIQTKMNLRAWPRKA